MKTKRQEISRGRGRPFIWEKMSVNEIRNAIDRNVKTVLVPVGVTEQHGYHLSTFTDSIVAREICIKVAEREDCFVAPLLPYAFSGGLLPGTINVQPEVTGLILADISDSLFAQGIKNVIFVLGHGGSEMFVALKNFKRLYFHKRPYLRKELVALVPVWEFSKTWMGKFMRGKDFHAGEVETSLMLYLAPESVKLDKLMLDHKEIAQKMRKNPDYYQQVEMPFDHPCVAPYLSQKSQVKVGVMGDPFKASRKLGETIVREIVDSFCLFIRRVNVRTPGTKKTIKEKREIVILE